MQKNNTHLTENERRIIHFELNNCSDVSTIARLLGRHTSTISREIQKHRLLRFPSHTSTGCCCYLSRAPYVCNGCSNYSSCTKAVYLYDSTYAQNQYNILLSQSRQKSHYKKATIDKIKEISIELIQKNYSIEAIHTYLNRKYNEIPSVTTLRRILKPYATERNKAFSPIGKEKKMTKHSPKHGNHFKPNASIRIAQFGHTYADFQHYLAVKPVSYVEMDCIEGKETDSKVLLTLFFKNSNMQLAYLLEEKTSNCVIATLDKIERIIGKEMFNEYFGIILTDNGPEFSNIEKIERSVFGGRRTKIFYCDLHAPHQKGGCERNHSMFRKVLKRDTAFDKLSDAAVAHVVNLINSYPRPKLENKSPYEVAMDLMHSDFFILLDLRIIDPYDIDFTPF